MLTNDLRNYFDEKTIRFLKRTCAEKGLLLTRNNVIFLCTTLKEIDEELRCCENAKECKKVLKEMCLDLSIQYNEGSRCYCVYLYGIYLFAYEKPRSSYYDTDWRIYESYGKCRNKVIDCLKHEIRLHHWAGYTIYAKENTKRHQFVWNWRECEDKNKKQIMGTNGVLLYKRYKEAIERNKAWQQERSDKIDKEVNKLLDEIFKLKEEKAQLETTSWEAKHIREAENCIKDLFNKPVNIEVVRG